MEQKDIKPQGLNENVQQETDIVALAKANKKRIIAVVVVVLAVVAGALIWNAVSKSNAAKADEAVGLADAAVNDSIALQLYKDAAELGHKSGNRAKLEVAIRLYQQKDYQGALTYLEDASIDDQVVAAGVQSLRGDCYVNLNEYDKALNAYDQAIGSAEGNPTIVPLFLIKKANVYRAQGNYEAEYKAYKTIVDEYPQYSAQSAFDVNKYMERAKAAAGK